MEKKLLAILTELNPDVDFAGEENLIADGLLDSFDIIALVGELNDTFDIEIGLEHLLPENFNSVAAMMKLIKKLQAER
ncbi:MAG TPA: acyl carrier protein [Firmicutes bacterium]|nr:acyl carrier protein [Bacillota bacterium]